MAKEEVHLIYEKGSAEIVEKKSRFLAAVLPVRTEEEALAQIAQYKKQYWDARHNCYAFCVGVEQPLLRFSDDGEPSGTAGKPILEVITGADLCNVLIVVTRYFGGVLLGTGGLVRAYTKAAQAGLAASTVAVQRLGKELRITVDYTDAGRLTHLFSEEKLDVAEVSYEENVKFLIYVPQARCSAVLQSITEATCGRAKLQSQRDCYYLSHNGSVTAFSI